MNQAVREQADRILFDRIAVDYAKKDIIMSSSLARRNRLLAAMRPVLEERSNLGTVVDIGCGVGAPAQYLAGRYSRYIGVDQSEEMIEKARTFNRNIAEAEFLATNVKDANLVHMADVILAVGALHHMTDLDRVMDSVVRVAKPGAWLVTIEPHSGNPVLQMMRWVRGIVDTSYSRGQTFFREHCLRQLFSDHGIAILSVRFHGFLSPPFAEVILRPQCIAAPLCRLAIWLDSRIDRHGPAPWKRLAFNIVIIGRFAR